jgi:receptor expression-enhancing protein 5/6
MIIFNLGGQLLTNFAGFVIPAYYSLSALFTTNKEDDTQWLTVRLSSRAPHYQPHN